MSNRTPRIDATRIEGASSPDERIVIYCEEATVWLTALLIELEKDIPHHERSTHAQLGNVRSMCHNLKIIARRHGARPLD